MTLTYKHPACSLSTSIEEESVGGREGGVKRTFLVTFVDLPFAPDLAFFYIRRGNFSP